MIYCRLTDDNFGGKFKTNEVIKNIINNFFSAVVHLLVNGEMALKLFQLAKIVTNLV